MIGLYNNVNQDSGALEGTLISASNRLTVTLNSSISEAKDIYVAIRMTTDDRKTIGATTLSFEGNKAAMWAWADINDPTGERFLGWGEPLVIEEEIGNSNKRLKIRVKSGEGESVESGISTSIRITGVEAPAQ